MASSPLCFAAGFRGQGGMINQPLTDELIHRRVQSRTTTEISMNSVKFKVIMHRMVLIFYVVLFVKLNGYGFGVSHSSGLNI